MIIQNIKDDRGFLFVDEQIVNNKRYRVSSAYAPSVGIKTEEIRISVSTIDETKSGFQYEEVHAIDLINDEVKSLIYFDDRNRSTGNFRYTSGSMEYYDEVMESFNQLTNSGLSEFSDEALEIVNRVKETVKNKHSSK